VYVLIVILSSTGLHPGYLYLSPSGFCFFSNAVLVFAADSWLWPEVQAAKIMDSNSIGLVNWINGFIVLLYLVKNVDRSFW
jgi:hypothetical protein